MANARPTPIFNQEQIQRMRARLADQAPNNPRGGPETARELVQHCFDQMVRFSRMPPEEFAGRAVQFGLNLGRAQEMLGAEGGPDCWWRRIEPHLGNGPELEALLFAYISALGLAPA